MFIKTSPQGLFDRVVEPKNKLVVLTTVNFVAQIQSKMVRSGVMSVKILDEELRAELILFSITKFLPFFEEFQTKIQQNIIENGHLAKMFRFYKNIARLKASYDSIDDIVPALVLNMADLEIGFLVCLIPLALSVIAFICELVAPIMKHLTKITRDLLTFLYIIRFLSNLLIGVN